METNGIWTNNRVFIPSRGSVFAMQKYILEVNRLSPEQKKRLNELAWYASSEQEFVNRIRYALPEVYRRLMVVEMG